MSNREDFVQHAIAMVLDEMGVFWLHPPNEREKPTTPQELGRLIAKGMKPGASDVMILQALPAYPNARGLMLELKTESGALRPNQRAFLARSEDAGFLARTGKGIPASLQILRDVGFEVDSALTRLDSQGYTLSLSGIKKVPTKDKSPKR